jgi:organic hydroperoxide reductase OsmC/OhrA
VVVTSYQDTASGEMAETRDTGGAFVEVVLRPKVRVAEQNQIAEAERLHGEAARRCFLKNSVNFPVRHQAMVTAGD